MMKVDTGAKCNVMSLDTFKGLNKANSLYIRGKHLALLLMEAQELRPVASPHCSAA